MQLPGSLSFSASIAFTALTFLPQTPSICHPDWRQPPNGLNVYTLAASIAGAGASLLECLWQAADDTMLLSECEAYSYSEDSDTSHPATDQSGSLWSFTVFLINKRLNRILCLTCHATAKHANVSSSSEDDFELPVEQSEGTPALFGVDL